MSIADFVIWRSQTPDEPWDWFVEAMRAECFWYVRYYAWPRFCYVSVGTEAQVFYSCAESIPIPTVGSGPPALFNGRLALWACPAVALHTLWIGTVPPAEFPLP